MQIAVNSGNTTNVCTHNINNYQQYASIDGYIMFQV